MENNTTRYGLLGDAKRLGEILSVANKYKVTQGLTPDKVYNMFKDLGTAFIKLGQLLSLHPEVLPKEYCKALENLRNDAPTITTAQIREIISEEYGKPWNHVFSKIVAIPVGSASIAQVHDAYLLDGTRVAIKVQRPDSYQMMEQDVRMLKKALNVLKIPQIKKILWLINNALDETWRVAQEELNFIQEAENLERLAKILEPMEFAHVPAVYKELTTRDVLVMEYIDGYEITDHEGLIAAGYDLSEICQKLIRSYIKQWAEDLFFGRSPFRQHLHPGRSDRLAGSRHDGTPVRTGSGVPAPLHARHLEKRCGGVYGMGSDPLRAAGRSSLPGIPAAGLYRVSG